MKPGRFSARATLPRTGFGLALALLLAACSTSPPRAPAAGRHRAPPVAAAPAPRATPPRAAGPIRFIRPAPGATIAHFDGRGNKGIDIAGAPGDAVLAAADGIVVYAGSELRSYGNMIIVKHNDLFLTAYAHTGAMLVKENDAVRQGQKIAEIDGSSGTGRARLHFEVRRNGVAVNPQPYLDGLLAR